MILKTVFLTYTRQYLTGFQSYIQMENQYDTIVIRKDKRRLTLTQRAINAGGEIVTEKRVKHTAPSNAVSIENETETFHHQVVTHDFKISLMNARQSKRLTQKQLAQMMNCKLHIIQGYETGKVIPDGVFISKMNRVLGIKLPKIKKTCLN
jgi:ribosome-binding protein aMBF1 (putative translation factor)